MRRAQLVLAGGSSGPGAMSGGGGGQAAGDNPDASYAEAGGFTWVYLYPVKELAYWSLRPAIEAYLNPRDPGTINKDKALWERYNRIRANYVEEQAIEYLSRIFHPAQAYRRLKYRIYQEHTLCHCI